MFNFFCCCGVVALGLLGRAQPSRNEGNILMELVLTFNHGSSTHLFGRRCWDEELQHHVQLLPWPCHSLVCTVTSSSY